MVEMEHAVLALLALMSERVNPITNGRTEYVLKTLRIYISDRRDKNRSSAPCVRVYLSTGGTCPDDRIATFDNLDQLHGALPSLVRGGYHGS